MGIFDFISKAVRTITKAVFPRQFIEPEKPVKKVEDAGLKTFREFQEFIEEPIEEVEEEPEEEMIRKIVKTTGYSFGRKDTLYALTYENNYINRFNELKNKILDEFSDSHGIQEKFGYDDEYVSSVDFEYPNIEVGTE